MKLWGCESAGSRCFRFDLNGSHAEHAKKDDPLPEAGQPWPLSALHELGK